MAKSKAKKKQTRVHRCEGFPSGGVMQTFRALNEHIKKGADYKRFRFNRPSGSTKGK